MAQSPALVYSPCYAVSPTCSTRVQPAEPDPILPITTVTAGSRRCEGFYWGRKIDHPPHELLIALLGFEVAVALTLSTIRAHLIE